MRIFKEDFVKILKTERGLAILMAFNLLLSIILIVFAILNLNPNAAVVKTGYGDIGGYRDGTWADMLAFPFFGLIFGLLHGFLAVRIYHKRGSGMAKFFLLTTTMLILGAFLVLARTLGEG